MKTVFEKIIDREIPSIVVYEDEHCMAIKDINPKAPVHVLLFPKRVIARIAEAKDSDSESLSYLLLKAPEIAKICGLENGFRLVINNGKDGGETVPHLHIHILGGRPLIWEF